MVYRHRDTAPSEFALHQADDLIHQQDATARRLAAEQKREAAVRAREAATAGATPRASMDTPTRDPGLEPARSSSVSQSMAQSRRARDDAEFERAQALRRQVRSRTRHSGPDDTFPSLLGRSQSGVLLC